MASVCNICNNDKETSEVIILRCSHVFCWSCIETYLTEKLICRPKCPIVSCTTFLRDTEIRRVLSPSDIDKYEKLCIEFLPKRHICVLPECGEISIYDAFDIQFDCRKCTVYNCINCGTAHKGLRCDEAISENGQLICQKEILRAREVLQEREAQWYREIIVAMENSILLTNSAVFVCQICTQCIGKNEGIRIRQCYHEICRPCLREHVKNCSVIPVHCPFSGCKIIMDDRECREILLEVDRACFENRYLMYASRSLNRAEKCRHFDCHYLCEAGNDIVNWRCPLCGKVNCVRCNAIHDNESCQQYLRTKINCKEDLEIERCIREKIYMRCLNCEMLIRKTSGCNWIQCPACKMELCWINQTFRWGPKGRGDTSGGCKCGVNNKKCHPDCSSCNPHAECSVM